ncbi:putative mitochondrial protein [Vitis vinifera]|uniref:Putative mitochondrial protein n=1 Tax=Vitis vinifera TaxID=29760 RepID=A0A438K4Y9_VITVI|nr:putative mitochondrial protein [Vitis vinifera]
MAGTKSRVVFPGQFPISGSSGFSIAEVGQYKGCVLPALLEVEDGDWTYTVAVTVTGEDDGEDDGGDSIKPESSRSKDEMRSAGGCVLQKPQMVEGYELLTGPVTAKDGCPVIVSILALQIQNRLRGRKEREGGCRAQWREAMSGQHQKSLKPVLFGPKFRAKDFGPIAGPAHKGSSNGGPVVSSSSKLQRPGLSTKNKASEGLPQASSKTKDLQSPETEGEEGILQCKLINEVRNPISAVSERDLPLSGAFESILIPETSVSLGHPFCVHSSSSYPLESSHAFQRGSVSISPVVYDNHRGGASCSKEPSTLPLEGFQVEGLTPRKMVKVQSVLESLRVRIVRDNGKGVVGENRNPLSADKVYSRRKKKKDSGTRERISSGKQSVKIWDRRLVSSIWKGKSLDWVALPACGASGGIVILWDSVKFNCSENVLGSFSVTVKLNSDEEGSFWLSSVWCVGGDFNVIRRISEKMVDSRLTVNMRRFDEFIRESGLLDPPLRNAAFTWSNMQVDPICKRLDRFLFLLSGFFFLSNIQEALPRWTSDHSPICLETNPFIGGRLLLGLRICGCSILSLKRSLETGGKSVRFEGWEGHKFMRKLKFIKSKLKEWNTRVFGDLRERKKHILTDLGRIDRIEQEGNLNLELVSERILRRKELEDLLLKEEVQWRQKSRVKWIKEGDCNSKFFHRVATGRRSRKYIKSLISERGETLNNIEVISEEIVNFFGNLYSKPEGCLRKVLHETIFGSQGAFVEGRQILDAVLIANEVVDEKRRSGEEGGFSQKWRSWMRGCLSSSSFAILVNGNAKGWVKASRGLRQGDPLSPFLFTIVADVLSRLMIRAEETGITEGFLVGRDRTRVSLLQFADDTIFFSKASLDLLQNLKIILLVFGQVSECQSAFVLFRPPLGGNPKTIGFWDLVVERISRRLDGWKKAYLSLGGRITLIQSCLSHIPSYFLSLFKIPVSIASKIEKMQRIFFGLGPGKGREIT